VTQAKNIFPPYASIKTVDADYDVSEFDGTIKVSTGASDVTISLRYVNPELALESVQAMKGQVIYPIVIGKQITIKKSDDGAGRVIIVPYGSAKIDGESSVILYKKGDATGLHFDGFSFDKLFEYRPSFTYTPTLSSDLNIAASTAFECFVLRNGKVVHVSGKVAIDLSSNGAYELGISLPIASDFSSDGECVGIGVGVSSPTDVMYVKADVTNNRAKLVGDDNDAGNHEHFFNFTYKIL